MADIRVGDTVQAIDPTNGELVYSAVYQIPHRDPKLVASFVKVTLASGQVLRGTPDHFVYILPRDEIRADSEWLVRAAVPAGDQSSMLYCPFLVQSAHG
jgi:hypothetical protein